MSRLLTILAGQRGFLFPWAAVMYGTGIALYFSLKWEPEAVHYLFIALGVVACLIGLRVLREDLSPILAAGALMLAGLLIAGLHARLSTAPVLDHRYYGPVQGRVIATDRSSSDKLRLTLDQVVLERTDPRETPARVRVSLHGAQDFLQPAPGMIVIMTAHLSPPPGPAEPGGFDFRRMAWFERLGAVGYTRTPVLRLGQDDGGAFVKLQRFRARISAYIRASMHGQAGAFAAVITTGDRSGISADILEDLRASNLAHLLAISGLHMGLLAGIVFGGLRYAAMLIPPIALRWPVKKIAAGAAILAAAIYLACSGGNVATVRAFIMSAVILCAVILERRALTLRAVAVAALILLTLYPESLIGPGFQMSFAATASLIAVFSGLRDNGVWRALPKRARPIAAVFVSSAVAGAATAPFAAAHFNQLSQYGLIANLLSVPVMGANVMPSAVIAAVLSPFGLDGLGFWAMEKGIRWILFVAETVASFENAVTHVAAPGPVVLPLVTLGGLFVILWQGRARLGGVGALLAASILWVNSPRPSVLISDTGGLVGLLTPAGRALNKPRGEGFVARVWLENDGGGMDQDAASELAGIKGKRGEQTFHLAGTDIWILSGQDAAERAAHKCNRDALLITTTRIPGHFPCTIYDQTILRQTGSVSIYNEDSHLRYVTEAETSGYRSWTNR